MNEKFTKGPLSVERMDTFFRVNATNGKILASLIENEADAVLFAAAPDMYEALESSAAYFEMLESATGVEHGQLHTIRAALKKAQGER